MKVAYLILVHAQPGQLGKLLRALSCDWAHAFVHVDKKSADFAQFVKAAPPNGKITFLSASERISVSWAGFSVVAATLNLLNAALRSGEKFHRFCLLSGADFPIRNLAQLRAALDSDREFMRVDRRLGENDDNTHRRNVQYFHFPDDPSPPSADSPAMLRRMPYDGIKLFQGSAWWSLTAACVEHIIEFVRSHDDYVRFHRWTLCPDEIFFHSIVKHSRFSRNLTHDFETVPSLDRYFSLNEHGCHYIDWSGGGSHPRELTADDYLTLARSDALFARKFDEVNSATLVDRLIQDMI